MKHVDSRTITIASFCAGAAGLDLALKLALQNTRTVLYVEREAYACAVLEARIKEQVLDDAVIWSDVATFDGCPWRGRVDIVVAGFSCQPWSLAGARKGTEDERWIWPALDKCISEMAPAIVFLENVPGLVSGNGIEHVLSDLAARGYDAEWGTVSAGSVGDSHCRERLFILAWLRGNERARELLAYAQHLSRGAEQFEEPGERRDTGPGHDAVPGREGEAMADASGSAIDAGAERGGREARPNPCGEGARAELGDTASNDERRAADEQHGQGQPNRGSGSDVADAHLAPGCPEQEQQPSDRLHQPDGSGTSGVVADAGRAGWQGDEQRILRGEGRGIEGGTTPELCRAPVADARNGQLPEPGREPQGRTRAGSASEESRNLADATRERSGGLSEPPGRLTDADALGSIPILCPRPNDTEAWRLILEVAPSLKPAVCRVSDELADELDFRSDRLRLAGNGVHPLVAACAFTLLASRALE